jgi:formylmethanofuran--tetrahydromethanopterin N-formyltransferase
VELRGVFIEDTFAEAFGMRGARVLITAHDERWARQAALSMTGFATSVIGCKCEAGIEREVTAAETPDGRPGVTVLFFTMDSDSLAKRLVERIGQTVLTCPTTACFDGLPDVPERMSVGKSLRVFGDGFQASKVVGGRRYWRVPVMEGEFLVEETFGRLKGVGGGNFLILAESADASLRAAEAAVEAMRGMPGVILPFPGGVVRSGSKVGSKRYKGMMATTNDAFAPTLRALAASSLPEGVNSVLEIVLDGLDAPAIAAAMRVGIAAACTEGVRAITAGNYGGKLGPHHFHLRQIMEGVDGVTTASSGQSQAGPDGAKGGPPGGAPGGAPSSGPGGGSNDTPGGARGDASSGASELVGAGAPPQQHGTAAPAPAPDQSAVDGTGASPTKATAGMTRAGMSPSSADANPNVGASAAAGDPASTPQPAAAPPAAPGAPRGAPPDAGDPPSPGSGLADLGPGDPETIP